MTAAPNLQGTVIGTEEAEALGTAVSLGALPPIPSVLCLVTGQCGIVGAHKIQMSSGHRLLAAAPG